MGSGEHMLLRSTENEYVEGSTRGDLWRWTIQRTRTSHYCADSSYRLICKTSKMSLTTCTMKTIVFSVSPTWRGLRIEALRMEETLLLEAAVTLAVNWHASPRRKVGPLSQWRT